MNTPVKRCPKCGNEYPITTEYFHRNKSRKDGFCSLCKSCNRAHVREWQQKNKDRHIARATEWNKSNLKRHRSFVLRWRRNNKDRHNASTRRHYRNHLDDNREKGKIRSAVRRTKQLDAGGKFTKADIDRQCKAQKSKCYYCKASIKDGYHIDHVVPVSKGGTSNPENLVLACKSCNSSKKDKLLHEWPKGGKLL